MAKREISIVLKAKNELQIGLAKAKKEIEDFADSVTNVGKWLAGAFLAAGTAVAGFAAKAIASYAENEAATARLQSVFRSFGEEVDVNVQKVQLLTKAIQSETGVNDVLLQSRAAQLKMLGIQTTQLEAALKMSIAMERAGMAEEAAVRAVANAYEGNIEGLAKFIPAMRTAQTETEKLQILNDFLNVSYRDQMATVETIEGRWTSFKDAIGDVFTSVGEALNESGIVQTGLQYATTRLKEFGEALSQYVKSDGFINLVAHVRLFGVEVHKNFMMLSNTIHGNIAALYDLIEPFAYLPKVALKSLHAIAGGFVYLGEVIGSVAAKIASPFSEFIPPDSSRFMAALEGVKNAVLDVNAFTLDKTMEAQAVRIAIEEEYADAVKDISDWQINALEKNSNKRIEKERQTGQAIIDINEQMKSRLSGINAGSNDELGMLLESRVQKENNALDRITQGNLDASESLVSSWKNTYTSIADAADESASRQVAAAERVRSSMANTGFNEGLLGRTFETGGTGGAEYQQAISNLRRQGFQIGGVATPGANIAGISDIVRELQRIRAQNDQLLRFG